MQMSRWEREAVWWKTYDYLSGHTYILAKKFTGKTAAIAYAKSCGMVVIPQSTVSLSELEYENLLLKKKLEELKYGKEGS